MTDPRTQQDVYTIIEKEGNKKNFFVKVGRAFENKDGSLNVYLDAVPVNGKLHIRSPKK